MRYISTRGDAPPVSAGRAMLSGLAPDGGLYHPEQIPLVDEGEFPHGVGLPAAARVLLAPFVEGDPVLSTGLAEICDEALDFPVPLVDLAEDLRVLELFHGPTAAFKDVGARFLASSLARLAGEGERPRTVLVATSGDTGGAVAAAFHGRPGFRVVLLYPAGRVSPRQEAQLTAWGGNVTTLRVEGDFDDCQRMVKAAFADAGLRKAAGLTSANSISIGRLLPQMSYYAMAALAARRATGIEPGFVIPTGNLGNGLACIWARRCGLPVGPVVLATNANDAVARFFAGEAWHPRTTRQTLATAMDVGNPSNMERLLFLTGGEARARREAEAIAVDDEGIREAIRQGPARYGQVWCPHTATAVKAWESLPPRMRDRPWILVATAHPAKFEDVVEPLVGHDVPPPPALAELLAKPRRWTDVRPDPAELRAVLLD